MQAYFAYRAPIKINTYKYRKRAELAEINIVGTFNGKKDNIKTTSKKGGTALSALLSLLENYISPISIESYRSQSKDKGENAISIASISISYNNALYTGIGEDIDIEVSALKALVNAVNRALTYSNYAIIPNKKVI